MQDPWIPLQYPYIPRLKDNITQDMIPSKVIDLMAAGTSQWDIQKLQQLFINEDAEAILTIPLPIYLSQDRLIWNDSKDGKYTAKSGYHKAMNRITPNIEEDIQTSTDNINPANWKTIWDANVPNKIKIFLWKLLWNGIPTCEALNFRLKTEHKCPHCHQEEDRVHLLFHCDFAAKVWFLSPLALQSRSIENTNFHNIWSKLISEMQELDRSEESIQLFFFLIWAIWKARNNKAFKEVIWTIEDTVQVAVKNVEEYQTALTLNQQILSKLGGNRQRQPTCRSRSTYPDHFVRISYDGATNKEYKFGTVARVAKLANGVVQGAESNIFRGIWDPGILEFLALREAMRWAKMKGWRNVIFEGDAIQVTDSVNSGNCSLATGWGICQDIWHLKDFFEETMHKVVRFIKGAHRKVLYFTFHFDIKATVLRSSSEAEYRALTGLTCELQWLPLSPATFNSATAKLRPLNMYRPS
ncbi:uncharacterized protein LOC126656752 [Mercurialis annua]|uniref:uncharacterized protein LOC126656752 n=1 Tax=Mercurialis annua TaxID=3986 RepID=UPI00215E29AB|nr:uncharacterized protein LOC126656752 [Mercurialis annua]